MKNLLGLLVLLVLFTSCQNDEICTKSMDVYEVSQNKGNQSKSSQTVIQSPLSGDVYIDGDAIVNGSLNTNGHNIEVTGHLIISGNVNLGSTSIVKANGITIAGNVNLNGGTMGCNDIVISGNVNGSGTVFYCVQYVVTGYINQNQQEPIFQYYCDEVLSNNEISWEYIGTEDVDCSVEDGTVFGNKRYLEIN